ncbi:MAG TPA: hypothetical protein VM577_10375 [Anaerovoracaceae bacterium]|nr:hypothetical protein [Anaerovoracaceae bacterium]
MDTEMQTRLTWSQDWLLHGDSLAGILFRLGFSNALSPAEIKNAATSTSTLNKTGYPLYQRNSEPGQWSNLCRHMHLSRTEIKIALLGDILEDLRWTNIFSERFRYCPDCLGFGYHARYFQIQALKNCPIHRTELLDTCLACGAKSPFYGLCLELFGKAYCCPHCHVPFSRKQISIRGLFEPEVTSAQLKKIWSPLDEWLEKLGNLNLGFATLREWVVDGESLDQGVRKIDAIHVLATILPLPQEKYSWNEPTIKRKAFFFSEGTRCLRKGRFEDNYVEEAYQEIRKYLERKFTNGRITILLNKCKQNSWGVFKKDENNFGPVELAYVLWRMRLEHLTEPALTAMPGNCGIYMDDTSFPLPFWLLNKSAWKILFLGMYRSYMYDVALFIKQGNECADVLRFSPLRNCCILPSTDMHQRGRGMIAYPISAYPG